MFTNIEVNINGKISRFGLKTFHKLFILENNGCKANKDIIFFTCEFQPKNKIIL